MKDLEANVSTSCVPESAAIMLSGISKPVLGSGLLGIGNPCTTTGFLNIACQHCPDRPGDSLQGVNSNPIFQRAVGRSVLEPAVLSLYRDGS